MAIPKFIRTLFRRLSFRGLSIQQRLPLLIFVLLLCIIVSFTLISYIGVKKAALKVSNERLHLLTQQLSSLFGESAQALITTSYTTASQEPIRKNLLSGGRDQRTEALEALNKLGQEKVAELVALLDTNYHEILYVRKDTIKPRLHFDSLFKVALSKTDFTSVGNIYPLQDSLYYPIIVPVKENQLLIGYLVRWRLQYSGPKAIEQFRQLLGTDARLYIGNTDGSLWTDLIDKVPKPPIDTQQNRPLHEYSNLQNIKVIAAENQIPHTSWTILVEFPRHTIIEPANRFLRWVILVGIILIAIGLLGAWLMSRNITTPLKKLTAATSAIAAGDYSLAVEANRADELGKLARTFNAMTVQVNQSRQTLEKKVSERTAQLEKVNKELESFSYSVSHDLRAPLRSINGYATILKEDYTSKMDEEANRLADKIIFNAQKMGKLIDDLIAFSQMGSKEIMHREIDMKKIATSCLNELLQNEPQNKYDVHIGELVSCHGDESLIKQVWMNLISNAIKYSSKQELPCIEIGCTNKNNSMCTYYIRDNGVGFDMKYAHKLFGVFQRLHSPKQFEGTGIGLAFVKRIIVKHGGNIWAESVVDDGTTFYFTIPNQV